MLGEGFGELVRDEEVAELHSLFSLLIRLHLMEDVVEAFSALVRHIGEEVMENPPPPVSPSGSSGSSSSFLQVENLISFFDKIQTIHQTSFMSEKICFHFLLLFQSPLSFFLNI